MRQTEAGFTLMEVFVAMLMLGLILGASTAGFTFSTNLVGENTTHAEAIALAQEAMEDLRTQPYADVDCGSRTSDDGAYTVVWDVQPDTPEDGMKQIVVTTSWQWKGEARTYALHTIYAKLTRN